MKIVFGVVDMPYAEDAVIAHKPGKPIAPPRSQTSGEVAEDLERRYRVMEFFFKKYKTYIQGEMVKAMQGAIVNLVAGGPVPKSMYNQAYENIAEKFRRFLDSEEMAGLVAGVPTRAAMRGVNHRLKSGIGPRRPSFIDTGTYQRCMRVWDE